MSTKKEHVAERRVRMLRERMDASIERMSEWLRVDGRPMFYTELSEKEELKLFLNPQTRPLLERNVAMIEGEDKLLAWQSKMNKRVQELAREVMGDGDNGLS